jgi:hypothetical protein
MANDMKFTKSGEPLADIDQAWRDRLTESLILREAGRHGAAIALGLYALEIMLKSMICRRLNLDHLPVGFQIHDLDGLLILTGMSRLVNQTSSHHGARKRNWDAIRSISKSLQELRYTPDSQWNKKQADTFFYQLNDPDDGVLPWLSSVT